MKFRCSVRISFSALSVLVSIVFSVLCIYLLFEERKEVDLSFISSSEIKIHDKSKYTAVKGNLDLTGEDGVRSFLSKLENYRYQYDKLNLEKLLCVPLNEIEILRGRDELQLERLGDDLADHLNETFHRLLLDEQRNASEIHQKLKIFDLTVLRFLRSRSYYLLRNKFCLVLRYFQFTEFFVERIYRPVATAHLLIKDSHQVVRLKEDVAFDLRLIFNNNNPNLNCSTNSNEFDCLQSCFKERFQLSKYFYNGNETGTVRLMQPDSNLEHYGEVAEHEGACFRRCDHKLCVVTDFQKKKNIKDQSSNNRIKVSFFEFSPLISNFSFYVQLAGLTLSFFGINCYNFSLKLVSVCGLTESAGRKRLGSLINLLVWSVCLAVFVSLSGESIVNYSKKVDDRMAKTSVAYSRRPEKIGLVVCVPVGTFLPGNTGRMTLAELELGTNDAFNRTVDELYLEFINKRFEVDWRVNDKKLFNANDYSSELGRCFLVDINPERAEAEFHSIWSELKLVITFKHPMYELYILPEGQNFNYNSFRYDPNKSNKFNKVIFKSSPLKCVNYRRDFSTCDSRWNCLDECVVNKSIENELNIPILHVIDKNLFSPIDWSDVRPNYNLKGNPKIEDECREEISSPDCYKQYFERDAKAGSDASSDWSTVKTDLYSTILLKTAADESYRYDVLLDFLNVETIVFDFKMLHLLTAVALFLQVKVFELHWVSRRLLMLVVYLICLIGFTFHALFIYDQVQNNRLVLSTFYEELNDQPMPDLMFCFQHDGLADYPSGNLTGRYLEEATNEIRADTVFERIRYLSNESRWIESSLSEVQANETRFQRNGMTFERFYFTNKKCLSIKTDQSYRRGQFYFDDSSDGSHTVLQIHFNRSFIEEHTGNLSHLVTFFTRTNDERYLSDIKFLNFSSSPASRLSEPLTTSYTVQQQHFEIVNNDKFRLIKNPMLFRAERFSNVGKYIDDLREHFSSEFNAATLELPLTERYFELPINDTLFQEYDHRIRQKKGAADRTPPDGGLIYERKVIENRLRRRVYDTDEPHFKFNLKFGKFKQVHRSKDNLAKSILNLLNLVSLWLIRGNLFQLFVFKSGLFAARGKATLNAKPTTFMGITTGSKVSNVPKMPEIRAKSELDLAVIEPQSSRPASERTVSFDSDDGAP